MENSNLYRVDVVIVLGSPREEDGGLSKILLSKIEKGVELLRYGYASNLLLTGGGEPNQAKVMGAYAQDLGVHENKLYIEEQSVNTVESAAFSTDIMAYNRWESAIVVTSSYHFRRTKNIFSKFDYDFLFVKSEYPVGTGIITRMKDIIHEMFSYITGDY